VLSSFLALPLIAKTFMLTLDSSCLHAAELMLPARARFRSRRVRNGAGARVVALLARIQ